MANGACGVLSKRLTQRFNSTGNREMDENLIEHVAKDLYHSMSDMKPREFPTGREWEGVIWDAVSAIKAMQSYKHSEACIHEPLISGPISNSCRKCGKIYPTAECPICRDANDYCVWHQPRHSLPDILKIQGDANILLDGINSIELFDDEIRYDGKTIYRGKYKRGEERDIIAKYTEAQRNKHSDDRDPDDIVRECDMRIEEAYKRKEQIMAEACGITTKTRETDG